MKLSALLPLAGILPSCRRALSPTATGKSERLQAPATSPLHNLNILASPATGNLWMYSNTGEMQLSQTLLHAVFLDVPTGAFIENATLNR